MSPHALFQWAAAALVVSGISLAAGLVLHPMPPYGPAVATSQWAISHFFYWLGALAGMAGIVGLYLQQRPHVGILGFVGAGLAVLGLALITSAMYFEAFIAPFMAGRAPELFESFPAGGGWEGFLAGVIASGALFGIGFLLFGITMLRARSMPRVAVALAVLGGVPFAVNFLLPRAVAIMVAVAMAVGLLSLGFALWSGSRAGAQAMVSFLVLALLVGCSTQPEQGTFPSHCFVLPGAGSSVTQSYRVTPAGIPELTGEARGGERHMRAAFHPNGRRLYINSIGPEGWLTETGDTVRPGIRVLAYAYDPDACRVGAFLGAAEMGSGAPNGERVYGLTVDPAGRFLYQTTGSLRRIRLYDLDAEGIPVPRNEYDVTAGGAHACAQIRRLVMHSGRGVLYANCNNRDLGPEVDEALQVWRVSDDGAIVLIEHHTLENMNGGVLDPVVHPSGDWLYHPVGTTSPEAPRGSGGYILLFRIGDEGGLSLHDHVPVRVVDAADDVHDPTDVQVLPITLTLDPDGSVALVALHAILGVRGDSDTAETAYIYPHEFVAYAVQDGGERLVEQSRIAALKSTRGSSHHGGTLTRAGGESFYHSYLTDYDSVTGGVLQNLRMTAGGSLIPLDPPWIDTGLRNGRQLIAVR